MHVLVWRLVPTLNFKNLYTVIIEMLIKWSTQTSQHFDTISQPFQI